MATKKRKRSSSRNSKSNLHQLQQPQAAAPVPSEPQPSGGIMDALLSPFRSPKPTEAEVESAAPGGSESPISSDAAALPPDLQAKLDRVPDHIGEDGETDGGELATDSAVPEVTQEDVRNLLSMVAFEEDDVRAALMEAFDWIAEKRRREHWKLTDRQSRLMTRPVFMLLNGTWTKVCAALPDIIIRMLQAVPGSAGCLVTCAPIVGAKAFKDFRITQAEKLGLAPAPSPADDKSEGGKPAPSKPEPKPMPMRPPAQTITGLTREGVPMASGTVKG